MDKETKSILVKVGVGVGTAVISGIIINQLVKKKKENTTIILSAKKDTEHVNSGNAQGMVDNSMFFIRNFNGLPGRLPITYPRGIRNNNPGNVIVTKPVDLWKEQVPYEFNNDIGKKFHQFKTFEHGLRAMVMTLYNGYFSKGLNTTAKIINKYAPKHENNVNAYVDAIYKFSGISKTQVMKFDKNTIFKLVRAMIQQENGSKYKISETQFNSAWSIIPSNMKS